MVRGERRGRERISSNAAARAAKLSCSAAAEQDKVTRGASESRKEAEREPRATSSSCFFPDDKNRYELALTIACLSPTSWIAIDAPDQETDSFCCRVFSTRYPRRRAARYLRLSTRPLPSPYIYTIPRERGKGKMALQSKYRVPLCLTSFFRGPISS